MEKRSPAVPEPMEMLAGHITDYLHYLKHDCGLRVSIHEFQRIAAPFLAQFLPYRIHDNPFFAGDRHLMFLYYQLNILKNRSNEDGSFVYELLLR